MKKQVFPQVTFFVVYKICKGVCALLFVLLIAGFISLLNPKTVSACVYYDMYGCGSYGNYYGYTNSYYSPFVYYPSPSYQYVYNPQVNRGNYGGGISSYTYVQYPYYTYQYFQNPAPSSAQNNLDVYNYVQYPYQKYVYNR